jgi:uncharacterized coiled-coil protein SlyX
MTEFSRTESTYTDDTIAVMRDTITAQRETIAAHRDHIEALQAQKTDLVHQVAKLRATLAACPSCASVGGRQ